MKKILQRTLFCISIILLSIGLIWSLGLWIYQPISLIPTALLLAAWGGLYFKQKKYPGHTQLWLWGLLGLNIITFELIPGPKPEQWQTPWAKNPEFSFSEDGNLLTITNIRDFEYRSVTDYTPRYRTETYDLRTITSVDYAACHWDGMEAVCHTMMSFNFADGRHLVVSAETRLPEGEEQNAIGGLYKRYGLLYLFGTEADLYGLRTNYRHEDLMLMPLKAQPEKAREMLLSFVALQQEAATKHTAYNTVADNCSTGVIRTFRAVAPNMPWYYNFLPVHNGDIARVLYDHGVVQTLPGESFEAFRKRCYVGCDIVPNTAPGYSEAIRAKISPQ